MDSWLSMNYIATVKPKKDHWANKMVAYHNLPMYNRTVSTYVDFILNEPARMQLQMLQLMNQRQE